MVAPIDPPDLVTINELALSTLWAIAALREGLERRGVLTGTNSPRRSMTCGSAIPRPLVRTLTR